MTSSTDKATAEPLLSSPKTKSHCPTGAGLIDNLQAPEGSHTPPEASAGRQLCAPAPLPHVAQPAQLAEGYEHPTQHNSNTPTAIEESTMTTATAAAPTQPGTSFAGGFYAGRFQINGQEYALIVSPKEAGEIDEAEWGEYGKDIPATSYCDGLANTQAMAEAGSKTAQHMLALEIDGHADWYLPSRDELELCYRNLKPTTRENWANFRDGDNPSSVPPGLPYTKAAPEQTAIAAFQEGGTEAFDEAWYWASTQYSPNTAWGQDFGDGSQGYGRKDDALRARAVRRFLINSAI